MRFTRRCKGVRNYNICYMRVLGVDVGARRVGLAISDRSRTLARPLTTLEIASAADAVDRVADTIARLRDEDDGLDMVVVGLPVKLDGSASAETARAVEFIERLRSRVPIVILTEDERLTSREAESRLAVRERDWRKRKEKLDAAAAAIILQDYLDRSG
jgi:putative pre-16S rRNA nuclease